MRYLLPLLFLAGMTSASTFPGDWLYRMPIVLAHDSVQEAYSDIPIVFTEACFVDSVRDSDLYQGQSDGGDIRFSSDAAGSSRLPVHIIDFSPNATPASAVIQIWIAHDLITTADTVWFWFGTSETDVQPAVDATYGSEDVYNTTIVAVWHMEDDPTGTIYDATEDHIDLESEGTMTSGDLVSAILGDGIELDGTNDGLATGRTAWLTARGSDDITILMWAKMGSYFNLTTGDVLLTIEQSDGETEADNSSVYMFIKKNSFPDSWGAQWIHEFDAGSNHALDWSSESETGTTDWSHIAVSRSVTSNKAIFLHNGDSVHYLPTIGWNDPTVVGQDSAYCSIGFRREGPSLWSPITVDEIWLIGDDISAKKVGTLYSNQMYPEVFGVEGGIQDVTAVSGVKIIIIQ